MDEARAAKSVDADANNKTCSYFLMDDSKVSETRKLIERESNA